jgi:hypothetical protein
MKAGPILTNVVQNAPDCDFALVHDEDLRYVDVSVCLYSSVDRDILLTLSVIGKSPARCSLGQSAEF